MSDSATPRIRKRRARRGGAPVCVFRLSAALGLGFAIAASLEARAGDILRGGASFGAPASVPVAGANTATAVASAQARANANDALARTTQAMQAVRAMQEAARNLAVAGPNNLGVNPNNPTQQLPNVPNGLGVGGLQVAPGVPANLSAPGPGEDPALWQGAKLPVQTTAGGQTTVNIQQTAQQAILNWKTFNVGKSTTVNFDQSAAGANAGQWIAFNKINDPSGVPSQILGSIKAQGQVYVLNQNGILFGGSSQVNTRTFVASSLPINENLVRQGLLNNRDAQFLFSGLEVPGGSDGTPAFKPEPLPPGKKYGDVTVQAGAKLGTPASGDGNGGRVMLAGANVHNAGTISTPSGQAILAAGLQVGAAAHASDDPSLRGLDVWVGAVGDYAGSSTNSGLIETLTGSATMAGRTVNQLGVIESSTSVNLNGRIDLRASYGAVGNPNFNILNSAPFAFQNTGTVRFGEGSVTRILPDYGSGSTVPGTALPERSQINVEGLAIHLGGRSIMWAPNGNVRLRAGVWPYRDINGDRTTLGGNGADEPGLATQFVGADQRFLLSGGQIYLDAASLISVAGTPDVFVPLSHSILSVELRGSELADSPLQRGGDLRGVPLTVDIRETGDFGGRYWMGTPLGDVTGLAGLIQRNAAQLTVNGGDVTLEAGDSIVVQGGAKIDVSGGFSQHEGGLVQTSRLLQAGRIVDVAQAFPDQVYDDVYTGQFTQASAPRWGVTNTFTAPFSTGARYEAGYIEGAAGGALTLSAPSMALDGELLGRTIEGPRQLTHLHRKSRLTLRFEGEKLNVESLPNVVVISFSPKPPVVAFTPFKSQTPVGPFLVAGGVPAELPKQRADLVLLSPALYATQGFGSVSVSNPDGDVVVPKGVDVNAPAEGSLTLEGKNITIAGNISAPGGAVTFRAFNLSPSFVEEFNLFQSAISPDPPPNPNRGLFTLGAGAYVYTGGLIVDDRPSFVATPFQPVVIDGGKIRVESFSANLAVGSSLTVSGGVHVTGRGAVTYGDAGGIDVLTGKDLSLSSVTGGSLRLDATLNGYSGGTGGSLALRAMLIQVGGVPRFANTLLLQPDFFRQGGFTSYSLSGVGAASSEPAPVGGPTPYAPGIFVAPGTQIEPVAASLLAFPVGANSGSVSIVPFLQEVGLRSPASVSLKATGSDDGFTIDILEARGDVVIEAGARIQVDPGAGLTLAGDSVTVHGALIAPGGTISIKGKDVFALPIALEGLATSALTTVHIGPNANLSASGTTVLLPDPFGRRIGRQYDGGVIAVYGNIVAEKGSRLDVAGASDTLDFEPSNLGQNASPVVPLTSGLTTPLWRRSAVTARLDSAGGLIELEGSQMLLSDATLVGVAGGPSAVAGTLSVHSGLFYQRSNGSVSVAVKGTDINLTVTQGGNVIPGNGVIGIGRAVISGTGAPIPGMGFFAVDRFTNGGFDSLELGAKFVSSPGSPVSSGGNVRFQGALNIAARGALRLAAGGVVQADGAVNVSASYLAIGQPFRAPQSPKDPVIPVFQQAIPGRGIENLAFAPSSGAGSLAMSAGLIDVGNLSLQTISRASLSASGDIRGNGTLAIRGDLTLRAAQIYPATLASLNLFAYDPAGGRGSITVGATGRAAAPTSVAGSISLFASSITQGGVLRAPIGSIQLGWDGQVDFDTSDADIDPPVDPVSRNTLPIPIASQVALTSGSVTSVAAVDASSGTGMLIPFGLSPDGFSWVDPRGVNTTTSGLAEKRVGIGALSIVTEPGSSIDLRGSGDLYAYRWVPGPGGSIDRLGVAAGSWESGASYSPGDLVLFHDQTWSARVASQGQEPTVDLYWSRVAESFAVMPGFSSGYAAEQPFNRTVEAALLKGDPGYVFTPNAAGDRVFGSLGNTAREKQGLRVGDQLYIESSLGLSSGVYTLLPRRYALLPGAFVITPLAGDPLGNFTLPGGAVSASGYRLNAFSPTQQAPVLRTRLEIAPPSLVRARTEFADYSGNSFFAEAARRLEIDRPQRLPVDAGYLALQATSAYQLNGAVMSVRPSGGRGSSIDVSSPADIYLVGGTGTAPGGATAVLDVALLNSWGAESLLVGGLRQRTAEGNVVNVRTNRLTLNNPGANLAAPDVTLVSKARLSVTGGSSVASSGPLAEAAPSLVLAGDGALLRVSGDTGASFVRNNVTNSPAPSISIGAGARIAGPSVTIDSTFATSLDPDILVESNSLSLGSGQISVLLQTPTAGLTGSVVNPHLTLAGQLLQEVQDVNSLTLRSYRTIDFYGAGTFGKASLGSLSLAAAGLRGYGDSTGTVVVQAGDVLISNPSNVAALPAPGGNEGALQVDANSIRLGANAASATGYANVSLNAAAGIIGEGAGSFSTPGNLTLSTPVVTGARGSTHSVSAGGALVMSGSGGVAGVQGGLGAGFTFAGATVLADTNILLPSGQLTLRAITGDVNVRGLLDVGGTVQSFYDLVRYSDAGRITLTADAGSVFLQDGSVVSVMAPASGGNAGTVAVNAPQGAFGIETMAAVKGSASQGRTSGSFLLDAKTLPSFENDSRALNAGGFFEERNLRVRSGDVVLANAGTEPIVARNFVLSTDQGSIRVTGKIDASGRTGGSIELVAGGNLVLEPGSELTVHASEFSSAGKGGSIRIEAGAAFNGAPNLAAVLDLRSGAKLDLGVDAFVPGGFTTPGSSAFRGQFTGKLHLRAPRIGNDLAINAIGADIQGASSILAEGFQVYDLTGIGSLDAGLLSAVNVDAEAYMNAGYAAMRTKLLTGTPGAANVDAVLVIAPGVEIIDRTGDLVLGTDADDYTQDWDLSGMRYGPRRAPGVLTLRAAGDLEFKNALTDGFAGDFSPNDFGEVPTPGQERWLRPLMDISAALPVNTQSWSYRLVAGADLAAADYRRVRPLDLLDAGKGSLEVGKFYPGGLVSGSFATTASAIENRFQVIRTGAGDIDIAAGRDLQLRNQFASVYTAGVRLPYSNAVFAEYDVRLMSIYGPNDFAAPLVELSTSHPDQGLLGAFQQAYPAQYSMAGGDVTVFAQQDVGRVTLLNGQVVVDTSRQMPNNWLYRRGFIDPATGAFGEGGVSGAGDRSASTTWWVDFSNFFEGFGALGGGNVTLIGGRDIINADAVAPTNGRMPGLDSVTGARLAPDADRLLELGGGDVTVRSGRDISGGVYYVERGVGTLSAGRSITTNGSRSPSAGLSGSFPVAPLDPLTWLPTTLFLGKSQFDVSATGDVLLGPSANPFLLPQGINNKFWYKTYLNTFSADAAVNVSSLGGSVTHRLAAVAFGSLSARPILLTWLEQQNLLSPPNASNNEPWIRLAETNVATFQTVSTVGAPTLRSTAFAGNVNIVGGLNLYPSPTGTLEIAASGGVIGLQPAGKTQVRVGSQTTNVTAWIAASVNLSDADPGALPGVTSPLAYQAFVGRDESASSQSLVNPFVNIDTAFRETGSFTGVAASLEAKRALHGPGPLHAGDTSPARVYALGGDITALILFTPKATQIAADNDITDIAFYLQNTAPESISFVSAGRDIIPFNESGSLRTVASDVSRGNIVVQSSIDKARTTVLGTNQVSLEGDIQINGPGVLEVLAGRNLDLGTGANLVDGTSTGISSVGNFRNPFLSLNGSDIIALAGVPGRGGSGPALGLSESSLEVESFIRDFGVAGRTSISNYLKALGYTGTFDGLSDEQQAIVALEVFYRELRDAGRDSAETGSYAPGLAAIDSLFGTASRFGEVFTRARNVRTATSGSISIAAPGGGLTMASDIFGNPLTPPGIVTEAGGAISMFTDRDVDIGQARIFTLRGGDIVIWSSTGNIAAGNAPKTVVTAPPTRVVIDATSAAVQTDLGGLATGGGIGVLAAVEGVMPGNVDLIAPQGFVDAGDAGIRATGNLNIAAVTVLNASNIQVAGSASGVPSTPTVAAPSIAGLSAASNASGAGANAAAEAAKQAGSQEKEEEKEESPSTITVEVLGYGGD